MIPVVFIHTGNNPYLYHTLYQLKDTNPLVQIYLIGTDASRVYASLAEHVPIETLFEEARAFADVYTHYSTNAVSFELICIQRWFVLKAFMQQRNIKRCLYLDSDVLVYADVQYLAGQFAHAGMTLCGISGHSNFIYQNTLVDFCRYVFTRYESPEAVAALKIYYETFLASHGAGGVSDMTLLTDYAALHPGIAENTYCLDGRPTFDPSLEIGSGHFEMQGNAKHITFSASKPYGLLRHTARPVLFYTLHFQGSRAKKNMVQYIPGKPLRFWSGYMRYTLIYYVQKIQKKLFGKSDA